jgi:hypothetical protein
MSARNIFTAAILSIFTGLSSAFASGTASGHVDTSLTYNSGILVLVFTAFLALIIVVQAVPALISLYGIIKGTTEAVKSRSAATADK